ncbi:hypothetical protein [Eisenbergiella tayi]|uniref:hypothetical protein n=1 Tax=Eisenbergiella tayi TaxID=1432052 RepID=UPI000849567F|nr:hypothetical protein [Eisenbergiella tayi]ODR33130.1 hypothetical protein BEI60_26170 [Eisenbergiella tayi]
MEEIWKAIRSFITADNIALLSVIITVVVFIISRRSELKYKKHDDKKVQYLKLIKLMEEIFMGFKKDKKGDIQLSNELKKQFFDSGSSLLLYGSKKLYRQYLFFREFANNPLVKQCKYFQDNLIIYIMSDILTTMRKEVGLSAFNSIHANEALGFFVNDVTNNPIAKEKAYEAKFRIKMIKFELAMIDRTKLIFLKGIFYRLIKPLFAAISIFLKYILVVPFGRLIIKLFPKFAAEIQDEEPTNSK